MISFEIASISDADQLKKTLLDAFSDASIKDFGMEGNLPPGVNDGSGIDKAFESQTIYSIKDHKEVVGGIIIELRPSKENYLQTLWVAPEHQGKKIGHAAMIFLEASHSDAQSWVLETPKEATRNIYFYEKHGYKKYDEKSFDDGKVVLFFYRKNMPLDT